MDPRFADLFGDPGLYPVPAASPVEIDAAALRARARAEARAKREGDSNRIRNGVFDFLTQRVGLDPETTTPIMTGVDMVPILGDLSGGEDTLQTAKAGNWGQAATTGGLTALGMFLGPAAKVAKHADLKVAKELLESGADAGRVWDETGWFQGADKKWRFEIDDSKATLRPGAARQTSVQSGFEHPELFGAYEETKPFWGDLDIYETHPGGARGSYNPERDAISIQRDSGRSTMLHELQHGAQMREDFATGGNPNEPRVRLPVSEVNISAMAPVLEKYGVSVDQEAVDARTLLNKAWDDLRAAGAGADDLLPVTDEMRRIDGPDPREFYRRLAGEVEARNVQTRRDYTPEQRRANPPWTTEDVPRDQQIVRFGTEGPQLSADPKQQARAMPSAVDLLNQAPPEPQGIRAYHGSPHDFDAFSLDRIGTGEGAQAYGHGLYFADKEDVARSYRDSLTNRDLTGTYLDAARKSAMPGASDTEINALAIRKAQADFDRWSVPSGVMGEAHPDRAEEARLAIEKLTTGDIGRMYEVNINANPDDFLDWDKPLSEQSEKVRAAAQALNIPNAHRPHVTGSAAFFHKAGEAVESGKVRPGNDAGKLEASEAWRGVGIPGIKYLDQGSRTAGDGTRNYVVFDDKLIDIVRKYGIAALLGGGALGAGVIGSPDRKEGT